MMNSNHTLNNEALAEIICAQREFAGMRFAEGSFVALADGRIVGVGNSFEEADAQLEAAGVAAGSGMVCKVAEPVTETIR